MINLLKLITLTICATIIATESKGQGCVAVRNYACAAPISVDSLMDNHWQFSLGYRYLKSDRHFRGTHEEQERQQEHSEVINYTNSMDLSLTYVINNRWSVSATLPLVHSSRSSLYEHGFDGNGDGQRDRYTTRAYGIGDLRVTGYYRVLDPTVHRNRNVLLGLGLKLPTGQAGATDIFYRINGPEERVVDQSIQPGDGGWGINVEAQFYSEIFKNFGVYTNGFYLLNPMETNNVNRERGEEYERYFSVTDQFLARFGFYYSLSKAGLSFNGGVRMEGIPVRDLIGKDEGYRRPGHTISVEPGLTFQRKNHALEFSMPVAVYRNRPQSVADKIKSEERGEYVNGDAAFADYLVLITYSRTFGKK